MQSSKRPLSAFCDRCFSTVFMLLRRARVTELLQYLAAEFGRSGSELIGGDRAREVWKALFHDPAFSCSLVQAEVPSRHREIIGLRASVFVYPSVIDGELANPQPSLNARVFRGIDSGDPVVLKECDIRNYNTRDGLDIVSLCCWRKETCSAVQGPEVLALLASSLLRDFAGYRIKRLLCESAGLEEAKFLGDSQSWRAVASFGDGAVHGYARRALWLMTRESGLAVPWSIAAMMFSYREPVLHLHPSDQQLLLAALDGMTDQELSHRLGLHLGTIKKRWISLFDRVTDAHLGLLPDFSVAHGQKRGPQKRHRVLAYVRAHPEELRPFDVHLAHPGKTGVTANHVPGALALGKSA